MAESDSSGRVVVVFDGAHSENEPWMKRAAESVALEWVDNARVQQAIEADPSLAGGVGEGGRDLLKIGPHYRRALEVAAGGERRLAVYSANWLTFLDDVTAFVFDSGPADQARRSARLAGPKLAELIDEAVNLVRKQASLLPPERFLELEPGLSDAEKEEQTARFLAQLAPGEVR